MHRKFAVAVLSVVILASVDLALAIDETRRQVGSDLIEHVFDLKGTDISIGQLEGDEPSAHPNVAATGRGGAGVTTDSHALEVAGIMVSNHGTFRGMAPAATLRSDDIENNGLAKTAIMNDNNYLDGLRWLTTTAGTTTGAKVVNASIGFNAVPSDSLDKATLGTDYLITLNDFLFVKSSGNTGETSDKDVTAPGGAYNGITVGGTVSLDYIGGTTTNLGPTSHRFDRLANFSSFATDVPDPTLPKPDLVAPAGRNDTDGNVLGFNLATQGGGFAPGSVGTSYAAPHVAGVAAQLYEARPLADHSKIKAVLMNAADKTVRDRDNGPWAPAVNGLDDQLGTGQLNAWGSAVLLEAPETGAAGTRLGTVSSFVVPGFDPEFIPDTSIGPDGRIVATVTWDRAVAVNESGPNGPPPMEVYSAPAIEQMRLKLEMIGPATFTQNGAGGNVQHLHAITTPGQEGNYKMKVSNVGPDSRAGYSIAYAISPVDVNPGTQDVFFTVRDQTHTPTATDDDRIIEGRAGTAVISASMIDAGKQFDAGVESGVYKSTMNTSNTGHISGMADLGLMETQSSIDDAINALSFGRDNIKNLKTNGGSFWFSVDTYATGLSPFGVDNPGGGVFDEATIVNEAAGDIFRSPLLEVGADPLTNQNDNTTNSADADLLHPSGALNLNTTYADSYYLGLRGPELADNENDLTGLEGLGATTTEDNLSSLGEGFTFFSLDRDSPTGHTAEILINSEDNEGFRVYATAAQLGLSSTDNIDALLVQHLSGLDSEGWPVYMPGMDEIIFSVDRDSLGIAGSSVHTEHIQGEAAGDLFLAGSNSNSLLLEATDIGLQEVALGGSSNWLTDNLDALDIPDITVTVVPEPSALILLLSSFILVGLRHRRQTAVNTLTTS